MYEPSTLLGINEDYPANYGKKECIDHLPFNESLPLLQKKYLKILREFDLEIRYMEIENAKAALFLPLQKKRLAFHFHNENEYLLKHSQSILRAHHNPSFGQSLSPYVFWCCINNQLINATLKKVFRLSKSGPIPLTAKNINSTLINIIKSKEAEIISCSFRESLDQISNILDTTINDDGDLIENKFIYDTKHSTASVLLNRNKEVNRLAVQALLSVYEKDEQFPDDATTYLNACLEEIKSFIKTKGPKNDLIEGYISLAQSKLAIWDFIETNRVEKDGKFYLKNNQYKQVSKTIIDEANKALVNIKTHDKILKENVISFLQNHTYTGKDSEKKKIFNLLTELSYKVGSRKDIGGESFKEIIPLPSSNPLSYQLIT